VTDAGSNPIAEILEEIDVETWLDRESIDYRKTRGSRGTQLNVKECPSCGNDRYKVYIGAETGLGNCFACGAKYNRWKWAAALNPNMQNGQVADYLKGVAREQGWRPAKRTTAAVSLDTLKIPASYPIPIEGKNLAYLENRSITIPVAEYFHLRYCHQGFFEYTLPDGRKTRQVYDRRVIIPVFDMTGSLVSFQGRDVTDQQEKKYLFPPGFSSTGSHLYNGQNAMGAASIAIGEGAFDVFALKIALDAEPDTRAVVPVGSFGKHLSHGDDNSQLAKLVALKALGLKMVTFVWDGEPKAIDAAIEAALLVKRYGLVTRVAILPAGKDPNEVAPSVVRSAYRKAVLVEANVAAKMRLALAMQ
jgi:DNA primase